MTKPKLTKLARYLEKQGISYTAFSERVGCNCSTVSRIAGGVVLPKPGLAQRIERETKGKIKLADLYEGAA